MKRYIRSDSMVDNYRKRQVLQSDSDYNYLCDKLDAEVKSYLAEHPYRWWDDEADRPAIPTVRFRPSKELKQEAAERGYKIVKSGSKYVPDYEYYVKPLDFAVILNK